MTTKAGIAMALSALSFAIAGIAYVNYPGSALPFWTMHCLSVAMVLLLCRTPVSIGLLSFGGFLVLGHWVELMLHLVVGTRFIEPTGSFDGSGLLWDRALLWVAAGHAGVCGARLIDLACRRREFSESAIVPSWYPARRAAVWVATAVFMVATIAWNGVDGGFYQIGPAGRNLLPLKLHVAFSFWLMGGGAVCTAALVAWERQLRGSLGPLALLVPAAEGLATSFTTLSRATYVIRVAPYALMTALRPDVVRRTPVRRFVAVGGALVVGLSLSLAVVSIARAFIYPTSTADVQSDDPDAYQIVPGAQAPGRALMVQARQIPLLFLQRWIGLEGVLVFASAPETGWTLFARLMTEEPALRMDGSYQRLAGSRYRRNEHFIFMTLPGVIGLAASSGMPAFVAFCLLVVAGAIWMVEYVGAKVTGSALVGAVAATSLASFVAEMYSAYLMAIWVAEYICLLLAVGAIARATLLRRALERLRRRAVSD